MNPAGRGSGHGALRWDALASRMSEQRMALLVEVEEGAPHGGCPMGGHCISLRCVATGSSLHCHWAPRNDPPERKLRGCIRARSEWRQP
jgi:hypothetical protein